MRIRAAWYGPLVAAAWLAGCGGKGENAATRSGAASVESTTVATGGATAGAADGAADGATGGAAGGAEAAGSGAAGSASDAPRALFIGTSLTAGLGLADPSSQSWPAIIYHIADSTGYSLNVINAGLSGETSAGALRRADWLFRERYDLIVIETGANDGLRGLDPDTTAANIRALIDKARTANPGATILLVQMEAPTNLGPRYTKAFHDLYLEVARSSGVILLPFLLEGVGGVARLNQADGIHPTAEGARLAARNVWPGIRLAIRQRREVSRTPPR